MTREDKALELFKRVGLVAYNTLQKVTKAKNPPDVIYQLRKKGHRIESVWETTRKGKRHVVAYRYYSRKAA